MDIKYALYRPRTVYCHLVFKPDKRRLYFLRLGDRRSLRSVGFGTGGLHWGVM